MTRLFLRFYLGVILLLMAAWVIQAFVFRRTPIEENVAVVEDVFAGGARLARDHLAAADESNFAETLLYIQNQFDYPIRVIDRSTKRLDEHQIQRLGRGEAIFTGRVMEVALPESTSLIEMGPLPTFATPTQSDITLGLGAVFLLAALGIAVLLRPIANQLRSVERTALAIAGGDLTARIGSDGWRRSLPIGSAFNAMANRVELLLKSQKELMQAVSHELRTPLSRIKFATALLETADDAQQRATRVASIDHATEQLDELIGELLAYVKLDAGAEVKETEVVSITDIVDSAIKSHGMLHPAITFEVDVEESTKEFSAYRVGLFRAVGNLVGNAAKFAKSKVKVVVRWTNSQLQIDVEDDGNGIAPEDREAVFEPFTRLSGEAPGAGLGLAIVKRIALRAGGNVEVNQSALGGAQFRLTLPIAST